MTTPDTTPSGAEPRSGETPPGTGAVPRRDYACGAILLGGACKMWPESDGCPTHGVSCPVVPSPTPPGAGADLLARLLECVGRYGMDCAETKQLAPRYELTEAANAIVTELRRLAAEVETHRATQQAVIDALVVANIYRKEHDTDPRLALRDLIAWETAVALDPRVSAEARALQQFAAQQIREAAGPCPKRRLHEQYKDATHPELRLAAQMCTPEKPCKRCLPLPTPDLDAIREAAYDDGYAEGATDCDNVLTSMMNERVAKAERRGAERVARQWYRHTAETISADEGIAKREEDGWVAARLATLFPAALGGTDA